MASWRNREASGLIVKSKTAPFGGCFVCGHKESSRIKESARRMFFYANFLAKKLLKVIPSFRLAMDFFLR